MLSHVLTGTGMPQLFPFGDKRKLSFFRSAFLNCSYLLSVLVRVLEKCAGFVLLHLSNTNLLPESRKSAGMHLLQEEENKRRRQHVGFFPAFFNRIWDWLTPIRSRGGEPRLGHSVKAP